MCAVHAARSVGWENSWKGSYAHFCLKQFCVPVAQDNSSCYDSSDHDCKMHTKIQWSDKSFWVTHSNIAYNLCVVNTVN
jgi:hypothetical protein